MSNVIKTGNTIEKFRTGFQLTGVLLLSVVVIPLVLYLFFRKRVYDQKVVGKILHVSQSKCESDCNGFYKYSRGTGTGPVPNNKRPGDAIAVYYDPENPETSAVSADNEDYTRTEGTLLYRNSPGQDTCKQYTTTVKETRKVNGVTRTTDRVITKYICHITYEYTVKGKKYYKEYTKNTTKRYKAGDDINVYYESKNPANSTFNPDDYRILGGIISSVFTMVVVGLTIHYFMVSKVKGYGSYTLASRTVRSLGR